MLSELRRADRHRIQNTETSPFLAALERVCRVGAGASLLEWQAASSMHQAPEEPCRLCRRRSLRHDQQVVIAERDARTVAKHVAYAALEGVERRLQSVG